MGHSGSILKKHQKFKKEIIIMASRGFLASRNLVVVSKRGMAVPIKNWKRPAMEELPVPCVPWNQVMPGVINKNRLWFWTCIQLFCHYLFSQTLFLELIHYTMVAHLTMCSLKATIYPRRIKNMIYR